MLAAMARRWSQPPPQAIAEAVPEALNESWRLGWRARVLVDLGAVLLAAVLLLPWLGDGVDRALTEGFFRLRGPLPAPPEVVVVAIDDDSFGYLQRQWPWPRSLHARLVEALADAGARVIVLDILFDTPAAQAQEDRALARAAAAHGKVVFATARSVVREDTYTKVSWLDPAPVLGVPEERLGAVDLPVDGDGAVRRFVPELDGRPVLGLRAAAVYAGDARLLGEDERGRGYLIDFAGPPRTLRTLSYYQALQPEELLPAAVFRDKLVLVGLSSPVSPTPGRPDHFRTPFSGGAPSMSGVEIHGTIAHNLLASELIRPVPYPIAAAVGLTTASVLGIGFFALGPQRAGMLFSAAVVAALAGGYGLFVVGDSHLPLAPFLLAVTTALLAAAGSWYYQTSRNERLARQRLEGAEARIRALLAEAGAEPLAADVRKVSVFVSYRHQAEDATVLAELLDFLRGLRREGIELWTDQELKIGDRWNERLRARIGESDIALLLVSQGYLNSDYCMDVESKAFVERGIPILPLLVSPCEWQRHPWLSERQMLPTNGETLSEHYRDTASRQRLYLEVLGQLRRLAQAARGSGAGRG